MSNQLRNKNNRWRKLIKFIRNRYDETNLSGADLSGADLRGADLRGANLNHANLSYANLRYANLSDANLRDADLNGADLSYAYLSYANLIAANLCAANLCDANLRDANLSGANLSGADLSGADLNYANLRGANLSGAKGLLSSIDWLRANFKRNADGHFIVYKAFYDTTYSMPGSWKVNGGEILTEVCNPNRQDNCGCGVNFGTLQFVTGNYPSSEYWACALTGVTVVPFATDGKARTDELTLLYRVNKLGEPIE